MKNITLRITTRTLSDRTPLQAGDTDITPLEETLILSSVEMVSPEMSDGADSDTIELTTDASMELSPDGRYTISYEETELSGMAGTVTKLTFLESDRTLLTVIREGTVNSTLVLEEGKFHTGLYETPVMPLDMTTRTHKLENTVTREGGVIRANYSLRIGGVTATHNVMTAEVLIR